MNLHKLISRTVLATALLGTTIGGAFAGFNKSVSANDKDHLNYKVTSNSLDTTSNKSTNKVSSQADITQGLLTLDAVPNLNFGNNDNNVNSGNAGLPLQSSAGNMSTDDGNNDSNLLKVTDYRKTSSGDGQHGGWTLNVNLSNFKNVDNNNDPEYNTQDQWYMHLNKSNSYNDYNVQYNPNNYNRFNSSNGSTLTNSDPNNRPNISDNVTLQSNGNPSYVMGTSNNYNSGHGSTNLHYNSNTTSLDAPNNVQPGKYTATMSWTLSANLGSDSNNVS